MIKIGHASIDENGKISGGVAGDQTGREVCIRDFYYHKKGYYILRAKEEEVAELIAQCMEDVCANPHVGYDQTQRLSLYDTIKSLNFRCDIKTLKVLVECDCSSLVRVCLAYAGIMVRNFHTGNEKDVIMATGKFECIECEEDGSNLRRGDILVTKTKGHTVVVVRIDKEVTYKLKTLKNGSKGNDVTIFESIMKKMGYYTGSIDDKFGPKCVAACNAFQKDHPECGTNGKPDKSWGPKCWKKSLSLLDA